MPTAWSVDTEIGTISVCMHDKSIRFEARLVVWMVGI